MTRTKNPTNFSGGSIKSKKDRRNSGRKTIQLTHSENDVRYEQVWTDWEDHRDGLRDRKTDKELNRIKKHKLLRQKKLLKKDYKKIIICY